MTFEWDQNKNQNNKKIHNISFDEAQYTFLDSKRIIYKDIKHSIYEERFFCIGKIENGIATVRFTMRKQNIRIFGAGYWREGRKLYETKNKI